MAQRGRAIEEATAIRRLLAAGFTPIPVNGKRAFLKGWQTIAPTAADIETWAAEHPTWSNTGIVCTTAPCIDLDIRDKEVAAAAQGIVFDILDQSGPVRIGQFPRRAIPCKTDTPFAKIRTPDFISPDGEKHHLEILARGQQFVAAGIHPVTKAPYQWFGGELTTRDALPELTETVARKIEVAIVELFIARGWQAEKPKPEPAPAAPQSNFLSIYGGPGAPGAHRGRPYADTALKRLTKKIAGMAETGRNNALNDAAMHMARMRDWIDFETVSVALTDAMQANGYVKEDGLGAVRRTIASGWKAGLAHEHWTLRDNRPAKPEMMSVAVKSKAMPEKTESEPELPADVKLEDFFAVRPTPTYSRRRGSRGLPPRSMRASSRSWVATSR
jgi:hypothetical protein